jgi:DNA topoisomerase-1
MPPKFFKKTYKKPSEKTSPNLSSAIYLIIVESPSKCAKIESYLGPDYCCIASKGHIRSIDGLKSIDTKKTYEPTFSIIDEKKTHVDQMKSIVSNFSKQNIILASDDDREGEAIAWHICKIFDLPVETTKRIIFHEVTKPAIQKSIENPTTINMDLVHAQHARQVLDIIVGYKISPFLWKYLYNNKSNSLSAGRCQTPALRLVYDNEKEKETGGGIETKYKTIGTFLQKRIPFELNHEYDTPTEVMGFLEKSKTFVHKLTLGSPKDAIKSAPKPFHTSRLLQVASNMLHISPKETMNLCQMLYQAGYITYMRTESSQYSKTFLEQANKYIMGEWSSAKYLADFSKLENKDASNPHEAIRVTHLETKTISNKDDLRLASMYRLIWRNTLESCMADAKYNTIKASISAPEEHQYQYIIEIPVFLGWKVVSDKSDSENPNEGSGLHLYMQSIAKADKPVPYLSIDSTVVVRNKHQHYTEASLIHKLEDLGIGRPSTFATIVDTIIDRGYVKKTDLTGTVTKCMEFKLVDKVIEKTEKEKTFGNEKNKLVIQPTGILTVEFLIQNFEKLFSYEYTKIMESQLDLVSSGKEKEWSTICGNCDNEIKQLAKTVKNVEKQTYALDETHELVFQAYGPSIKHTLTDGGVEYLPAKKDMKIDLEKLKEGKYSLDDIIEIKNGCLGIYEDHDIFIKNGRYGPYVEWGTNRESIKEIQKPLNEITLSDIESYLSNKSSKTEKNVLRVLNEDLSVRKGKFGAYVYYKRKDMAKPDFLNIKKFNEGFLTCESETLISWLQSTYNIV